MFTHEEIRSFNELEMSVYNYILRNQEKVVYMKIRDLADGAHVSTTTVLRFCKKVGCEGYSEFKLKLKQYLQTSRKKQPDLDISAMTGFFQRAQTDAFQEALEKALVLLSGSTSIVFIGTGSSGVMGKYGARYFNNVGWFSLCIDDPFTPVFHGKNSSTVVVALSVSGTTEQTLAQAGKLKERGCTLISITNSANCPLAQISDCSLSYYIPPVRIKTDDDPDPEFEGYDITSQIPVMFILETLGRRLMGRRADGRIPER